MPEDFSSLLEALAAEGRGLARPVPVSVIETGGRARRRRRRQFTAVTSGLAACAVAAGVAVGFGSSGGGAVPVGPAPTSSSQQPPTSTDTSHFLRSDEAPNPGAFQWKSGVAFYSSGPGMGLQFGLCGSQFSLVSPKLHSTGASMAQFTTPNGSGNAYESIFYYASAEAASADYAMLKPDPSRCSGDETGHMTGTVPNGFAWVQQRSAGGQAADHALVVRSGDRIAYWAYQEYGASSVGYDTGDDQLALQRMADRLDGRTPVPARNTTPPANAVLDAAWLDPAQIPFATADKSHGWYQMALQPPEPGSATSPTDLCGAAGHDVASTKEAMVAVHSFHGTPSEIPVNPVTNYLYSGASQEIVTFPSAESAAAGFARARGVMAQHSCTFSVGSHKETRAVTVGVVSASGFSIQIDDTPGPSHQHVYYVLKGTRVSELFVYFEQGDNTTAGDAAVLAAMEARLP
ncbi:MAG: hypothetical protein HOV83_15540 [Catenulispora sp.]|nr:hypothetical protein [Catenulispora sp.]